MSEPNSSTSSGDENTFDLSALAQALAPDDMENMPAMREYLVSRGVTNPTNSLCKKVMRASRHCKCLTCPFIGTKNQVIAHIKKLKHNLGQSTHRQHKRQFLERVKTETGNFPNLSVNPNSGADLNQKEIEALEECNNLELSEHLTAHLDELRYRGCLLILFKEHH